MQVRLYLDEDSMLRPLIHGLRARGFDVMSVSEAGRENLADAAQLAWAAGEGRVLCTSNIGDFFRLHTEYMQQGRHHAGIVLIPQQRYGVGEQLRRILAMASVRSVEDMRDRVEFLSAW